MIAVAAKIISEIFFDLKYGFAMLLLMSIKRDLIKYNDYTRDSMQASLFIDFQRERRPAVSVCVLQAKS